MKLEKEREVVNKRELNEQAQGLKLLLAHVFSLKDVCIAFV